MPINPTFSTKRGKAAVAAAVVAAVATGWTAFSKTGSAPDTVLKPATIHAAVIQGVTPPAVLLAMDLIGPWEGLKLTSYQDVIGVWTVCRGETKGIHAGMHFTAAECETMFKKRLTNDYYLVLVDKLPGFINAPIGVQAAMTSLSYNIGTGGALKSSAAGWIKLQKWAQACDAMTAFNKAGGKVFQGLVNRREMGDASREGEAEICKSGLN